MVETKFIFWRGEMVEFVEMYGQKHSKDKRDGRQVGDYRQNSC